MENLKVAQARHELKLETSAYKMSCLNPGHSVASLPKKNGLKHKFRSWVKKKKLSLQRYCYFDNRKESTKIWQHLQWSHKEVKFRNT